MLSKLHPVEGCCVTIKGLEKDTTKLFQVIKYYNSDVEIKSVYDGSVKREKLADILPAYKRGMHVVDVPASITRESIGNGVVLALRNIGDSFQVLVEFKEKGKILWVPYENLRLITHITSRYSSKSYFDNNDAERVRLKNLAYAIELWNENTGALTHIDIDPLPHQIHLVHKIISSGNYNWMIADDVGLGKTIEIGMLIKALITKRYLRSALIICPGGLTKQWQSELKEKFRIADFRIFGDDFNIQEQGHWKKEPFVIASIDKIKREENLESISKSGTHWDLIIFDEAHRLSRRQYGRKFDSSARFKVAAELRKYTDNIILATATPHQGEQTKFQALLEILRPDLKDKIKSLSQNYNILSQLIIRNDKSKVTDNQGKLIFKGKSTHLIDVEVSKLETDFDLSLQKYLTEGYNKSKGSNADRAIGFVMNTYRKLASSSIMAIRNALERRVQKLKDSKFNSRSDFDFEDNELAFELSDEQVLKNIENISEFFDGEIEALELLVQKATKILDSEDNKIERFIDTILNKILKNNENEKVLIFTEYRATQDYIYDKLCKNFGANKVGLINGSIKQSERIGIIKRFDDDLQFLISTEAGGEGINLQKNCHIVINFDLPWNPMRLVQRIGRVYRYGQKKKVLVFNIQSAQTFDSHILSILYSRIYKICSDLSSVGGFDSDNLADEVLGIISENLDIEKTIIENRDYKLNRTEEEIFEAIDKAREAAEKQKEIFKTFSSYNPDDFKDEIKLEKPHIMSFVFGMLDMFNIAYKEIRNSRVYEIEVKDFLQNLYKKQKIKISFSKDYFDDESVELIDYNSELLVCLIKLAKANEFHDGVSYINLPRKSIATAILRWQNDQGLRQKEEFVSVSISNNESTTVNDSEFTDWLLDKKNGEISHTKKTDKEISRYFVEKFEKEIENRLAEFQNNSLFSENFEFVTLNWC